MNMRKQWLENHNEKHEESFIKCIRLFSDPGF